MLENLKEKLKEVYGMKYMKFDDGAKGVAQRAAHVLACSTSTMYGLQSLARQESIADLVKYEPIREELT